jgi:hypothetical protein
MKIKTLLFSFVLFSLSSNLWADSLHFKTPALNGKLVANNLEMTDWQAVMVCHFNYKGSRKQSIRYPQTFLTHHEGASYSLKIKAGSLVEVFPNLEPLTCAYKLLLIGRNTITHQASFGEILLLGKESGVMTESELQTVQDTKLVSKLLMDRTQELTVTNGKEGGIVEDL